MRWRRLSNCACVPHRVETVTLGVASLGFETEEGVAKNKICARTEKLTREPQVQRPVYTKCIPLSTSLLKRAIVKHISIRIMETEGTMSKPPLSFQYQIIIG